MLVDKSTIQSSKFCEAIQKNNKVCGRNNCKIHKAKILLQKEEMKEKELIEKEAMRIKEENKELKRILEENELEHKNISLAMFGYVQRPMKIKF
jgi:hypothetical protein